ncbi:MULTISPECIES: cold shock domain-containing protein [unclassified Acinetobacter]|uniref:cold shock domain-containing protein n=1 Tax=unclassified Acinetobacter TaxID=196816 RepID=UPI002881E864|nr:MULTISPECIES: cold shock domain-containing protein [unclassified Acinetobacter]MDT0198221.1 cold shock domain-containing protein [Acinetobacter sp. RG5]MDT0229685.1 cold shock domain-containing protein [Acinetobacter sp. RRD8]
MFQEGKIKTYNEDRGFGFIQIEGQSKDLFFHVKDFPNKNIPPKMGEKLKFLIVEDNGKFKANHIVRLDIKQEVSVTQNNDLHRDIETRASLRYEKKKSSTTSKIITLSGLVIIVILAGLVYNKYQSYQIQNQQKLEGLMVEQRAAQGDLPMQGLSEQGRKNLENRGAELRIQSNPVNIKTSATASPSVSQFKCDGRTRCPQMNSYEEAVFFIRNCSGTKMDGDGIPCEDQFGYRR